LNLAYNYDFTEQVKPQNPERPKKIPNLIVVAKKDEYGESGHG
jgi:hypothetical protein